MPQGKKKKEVRTQQDKRDRKVVQVLKEKLKPAKEPKGDDDKEEKPD